MVDSYFLRLLLFEIRAALPLLAPSRRRASYFGQFFTDLPGIYFFGFPPGCFIPGIIRPPFMGCMGILGDLPAM